MSPKRKIYLTMTSKILSILEISQPNTESPGTYLRPFHKEVGIDAFLRSFISVRMPREKQKASYFTRN